MSTVSPDGSCTTVTVEDDGSAVVASCNTVLNQTVSGGGVSDGDKGDITVSGSGSTWTIDAGVVGTAKIADSAVTYAKLQPTSAAARLLGRPGGTGSTAGTVSEISVGNGLKFDGASLVVSNTDVVSTSTQIISGTGLTGGTQTLAGNVNLGVDFATSGTSSATKVVRADDLRLSNARTPTAHALSHAVGQSDAISPADIGAADSIHTHNASAITGGTIATARLGSGTADSSTYLRGDQTWATVSTTGGGTKTYSVFTPLDAQPPASNFATLDTRNSIAVLEFDGGATDESTTFVSVMPEAASLGSGLKVRIHWMADTATSGNVRWGVQFERMNTDLDTDSFDTSYSAGANEANGTANGTCGIPTVTEITITAIDGITAGDAYRLKIYREASDTTNDTMSGDAQLIAVEVRSAA